MTLQFSQELQGKKDDLTGGGGERNENMREICEVATEIEWMAKMSLMCNKHITWIIQDWRRLRSITIQLAKGKLQHPGTDGLKVGKTVMVLR